MFGTRQTVVLDGQQVPPASMLTKGVAVAVDLSLTVGLASLLFYLISTQVPLDTPGARTPIGLGVAAAFVYLVFGRDYWVSPGRRIYRLTLVRLQGNVPGLFGRRISVHIDPEPDKGNEPLAKAILVIALSTVLTVLCLAGALTTTAMFVTVQDYVQGRQPIARGPTSEVSLSSLPRALLAGTRRGYVQVDATTESGRVTIAFYLSRSGRGWSVEHAQTTTRLMFANYSLGIADKEIPSPADDTDG